MCVGHERDYKKKGKKEIKEETLSPAFARTVLRERHFFLDDDDIYTSSTYVRLRGRKTYRRGEREREEKKE